MEITSRKFIPITVYIIDANGKEERCTVNIKPGTHFYPTINPKDPRVAAQLRVFNKPSHRAISFNEELPSVSVSVPTSEMKDVRGPESNEKRATEPEPIDGSDQGGWKVSRKGRH